MAWIIHLAKVAKGQPAGKQYTPNWTELKQYPPYTLTQYNLEELSADHLFDHLEYLALEEKQTKLSLWAPLGKTTRAMKFNPGYLSKPKVNPKSCTSIIVIDIDEIKVNTPYIEGQFEQFFRQSCDKIFQEYIKDVAELKDAGFLAIPSPSALHPTKGAPAGFLRAKLFFLNRQTLSPAAVAKFCGSKLPTITDSAIYEQGKTIDITPFNTDVVYRHPGDIANVSPNDYKVRVTDSGKASCTITKEDIAAFESIRFASNDVDKVIEISKRAWEASKKRVLDQSVYHNGAYSIGMEVYRNGFNAMEYVDLIHAELEDYIKGVNKLEEGFKGARNKLISQAKREFMYAEPKKGSQYLSDAYPNFVPVPGTLYVLNSTYGTGKTKFMSDMTKDKNFVSICPSKRLVDSNVNRFGGEALYQGKVLEDRTKVCTTINSLPKLFEDDIESYDIVVFDEIDQIVSAVADPSFINTDLYGQIVEVMFELCEQPVVLADADASPETIEAFKTLFPMFKQHKVEILNIEASPLAGRHVTLHSSMKAWEGSLDLSEKLLIAHDRGPNTGEYFKNHFDLDFAIHGDTPAGSPGAKFLTNPNASNINRGLSLNKAANTGLDLNFKVDTVAGFYPSVLTTPRYIMQSLNRERHWKEAHILVPAGRWRDASDAVTSGVQEKAKLDLIKRDWTEKSSLALSTAFLLSRLGARVIIDGQFPLLSSRKLVPDLDVTKEDPEAYERALKYLVNSRHGRGSYIQIHEARAKVPSSFLHELDTVVQSKHPKNIIAFLRKNIHHFEALQRVPTKVDQFASLDLSMFGYNIKVTEDYEDCMKAVGSRWNPRRPSEHTKLDALLDSIKLTDNTAKADLAWKELSAANLMTDPVADLVKDKKMLIITDTLQDI